eukprot:TRINITY_DN2083_c0_g1_i23.p2 TRINITY_DN2083_c0_g1~~TRINITY_DN2083_c0_g1_i23.p2  ORF type:complete len:179 (-),score=36.71 TRINITY_DN2083_c0_g1_i23:480-1016(-)
MDCLKPIVDQFETDDVLELLASVELLETFASSKMGMEYIVKVGTFAKIMTIIAQEDDGCGGLLKDKCLDFVTNLSRKNDEEVQRLVLEQSLTQSLVDCLRDEREECQERIVIALGAIGTSSIGLSRIVERPCLIQLIASTTSHAREMKHRICGLKSLAEMLENRFLSSSQPHLLRWRV